MAKAHDLLDAISKSSFTAEQSMKVMDEIMMVGIPLPLVKALSDEAAKRNMTFGQLMAEAINSYLVKTESAPGPSGPRLLTEG